MARLRPMSVYWLALLPVSFFLHLSWEYLQCQEFFVHGSVPYTWVALVVATLGDLALTGIAYGGVAITMRSHVWPLEHWRWMTWVSLEGLAVLLSIGIEINALRNGRWGYTGAAPQLATLGVSVVPILQLAILLPLSFALARLITAKQLRWTSEEPLK